MRQLVERADSGSPKALYDLARLHESGYDSIFVDSVRSMALYRLSAEHGYAPAMNYIGFRYYTGSDINKDIDSALYWIRKAANNGDITAAANLSYLLTESPDFPHDEEEALKWITIAAEGGVNEAQVKLIDRMSSSWEALPADSALQIGMKYYLENAPIMGVKLIEMAAKQNNPKAMAILGDAYSKGLGVVYDHQKAIDYFYEAALSGDPSAQFVIAEMLEIFPDAIHSNLEKYLSGASHGEMTDPTFWYEKAQEGGVTDSEKAYEKMFSFP